MKTILLISMAALAASGPAAAEPVIRTTIFDGPRVDATRVAVPDREAGTFKRDTTATRTSDGATASRTYDRTRTDSGVAVSGSATGFAGNTRSYAYERSRSDNGYTTGGTATGRNGQTYALAGQGTRTETGFTRSQSIANASGRTLYQRDVVAARADGHVTRNVSVTRAAGFNRTRFGGGRSY